MEKKWKKSHAQIKMLDIVLNTLKANAKCFLIFFFHFAITGIAIKFDKDELELNECACM